MQWREEDRKSSRQKQKWLIRICVWAQGDLLEEHLPGLSLIEHLSAAVIDTTDSKCLQFVRFLGLMKGQSCT